MNNKISFSIIIPCYNVGSSIESVLESLENQTYQNFEVIFIDDKSDTNHLNQLKNYLKSFKPQHTLICLDENQGAAVARNTGAKSATGDYICLLDSDDSWSPNKLQKALELIHKYDPVIMSHYMLGHEKKIQLAPYKLFQHNFLIRNHITTSSLVIKKTDWINFSSMRFCEDLDVLLKYTENHYVLVVPDFLGQLGRKVGSIGGLSAFHFEMRIGEIQAYFNYSRRKPYRFFWFPLLCLFSVLKHLRLKIRTGAFNST